MSQVEMKHSESDAQYFQKKYIRELAIEQCARVAELYSYGQGIAAAIRDVKDKP